MKMLDPQLKNLVGNTFLIILIVLGFTKYMIAHFKFAAQFKTNKNGKTLKKN